MGTLLLRVRAYIASCSVSSGGQPSIEDPLDQAAFAYWKDLECAIISYTETMGSNSEYRPFYVLGVPATYPIVITMLSTLFSFYISLGTAYSVLQ